MSRSGKILAKNDPVIEQLVNDPDYDIRPNGEVWSQKATPGRWKKLDPKPRNGGYKHIRVKKDGPHLAVHRIIYRKFVGPLYNDLVINHKDGDPSNNEAENLELDTQGHNNEHRFRVIGHNPVAGHRKITPEIAQEIRDLHRGGMSQKDIRAIMTERYGLRAKSTISMIVNNKIWNKEVTVGQSQ